MEGGEKRNRKGERGKGEGEGRREGRGEGKGGLSPPQKKILAPPLCMDLCFYSSRATFLT